jgi:hypothetical protein
MITNAARGIPSNKPVVATHPAKEDKKEAPQK